MLSTLWVHGSSSSVVAIISASHKMVVVRQLVDASASQIRLQVIHLLMNHEPDPESLLEIAQILLHASYWSTCPCIHTYSHIFTHTNTYTYIYIYIYIRIIYIYIYERDGLYFCQYYALLKRDTPPPPAPYSILFVGTRSKRGTR